MRIILFIGLSFIYFNANAENTTATKTKINAVTVYNSGALVSSSAVVNLQNGQQEITIENIPTNINTNAVQVGGQGDFTILSVNVQNQYDANIQSPTVRAQYDSLENLREEISFLNHKRQGLDQEELILNTNRAIGGQNTGVNIVDLQDAAEYYRTRFEMLYNERFALDKKLAKINKRINNISNELNQANEIQNRTRNKIVVKVLSRMNGSATLNINYIAYDCGWTSAYDIRSEGIGKPVQLGYRANVFQSTGADWTNVKLSLSTGNPNDNGVLPILYTNYLNFIQPRVYEADAPAPRSRNDKEEIQQLATRNISSLKGIANTTADYTQTTEGTLARIFDISLPYTILSDGKSQQIEVQNYTLNTEYAYNCVPALDPSVYLVAQLTDWGQYNLVPATASVFLEGNYVGETYLNTAQISDTLTISLGKDKGVTVSREPVKDFNSEKLIGTNKRLQVAYKTTFRNTKKANITIEITDRIPVSQDKDIEVKLLKADGGKLTEADGFIKWKLDVKAQKSETIEYSFEVKYPKDKLINKNF